MDLKSFGQAIRELAEEKGVAEDRVIETIELAVAAAYKKDYGKKGQIIRAKLDRETGGLGFAQIKIAVDESMIKSEEEIEAEEAMAPEMPKYRNIEDAAVEAKKPKEMTALPESGEEAEEPEVRKVRFNPERHIMLEEAQKIKKDIQPGEEIEFALEPKSEFGRIASQTAKQVIIQRIREAERDATYAEFKDKEGEVVSGVVQRIEGRNIFVDLGRGVGLLAPEEQIARERFSVGERFKSLLILAEKESRGPGLILSRTHPRLLAKLFELEVPEISAGTVEIKSIAREPGSRSKIAAASHDPAVDPVGSMVGQRGIRVSTVINEIGGEKIDIIEWSEDPARFVASALSPAKVADVELIPERREAVALVPDDQLSLAIGRGGQNVRLAAKLTGWKIDVRSASKPEAKIEAPAEAVPEAAAPEETAGKAEAMPEAEAAAAGVTPPEAADETAGEVNAATEHEASNAAETLKAPASAVEKPKKKRISKKSKL